MPNLDSPDAEARHAEYKAAFTAVQARNAALIWLYDALGATDDDREQSLMRTLIDRCRAQVDAGHRAWLAARRAWSDAAGLNLEPVDGV